MKYKEIRASSGQPCGNPVGLFSPCPILLSSSPLPLLCPRVHLSPGSEKVYYTLVSHSTLTAMSEPSVCVCVCAWRCVRFFSVSHQSMRHTSIISCGPAVFKNNRAESHEKLLAPTWDVFHGSISSQFKQFHKRYHGTSFTMAALAMSTFSPTSFRIYLFMLCTW